MPPLEALFARDQPTTDGLVRWGSSLVVRTRDPRRLDLKADKSERISVPGLDDVLDVAGDSTRCAVGLQKATPRLLCERGGKWTEVSLPPELATSFDSRPRSLRLAASGDAIAVSAVDTSQQWAEHAQNERRALYLGDREHWTRLPMPAEQGEPRTFGVPKLLLIQGKRVLLGYSEGEWGGGLWASSAEGGVVRLEPKDDLPIVGLALAPDGRLFVGGGLAHLGGLGAHVGVFGKDGSWTTLARLGLYAGAPPTAWNLAADSVEGLALDSAGRLYVLTGSQGVVRFESGKFLPATPGWPQGNHVYSEGLLIEGDEAVIATFDGGVLVWKLGAKQARRITLW